MVTKEINRSFLSIRFLLALIGVIALLFFGSMGELSTIKGIESSVFYYYDISIKSDLNVGLFVFSVIPCCLGFCYDLNRKYYRTICFRTSLTNYAITKYIVNFITAFLVCFLGILLYVLILHLKFPLFLEDEKSLLAVSIWGVYIQTPIVYFIISGLMISLYSAFLASLTILLITVIPNEYICISTPVILRYIIHFFCHWQRIPAFLNFEYLSFGYVDMGGGINTLLFSMGVILLSCVVIGVVYAKNLRGRVRNGQY